MLRFPYPFVTIGFLLLCWRADLLEKRGDSHVQIKDMPLAYRRDQIIQEEIHG